MIVSNNLPASERMSVKHANRSYDRYSSDSNMSRFECWNISKVSSREEELVDEMKRYRLEVLRVSEVKMRGNSMKRIGDAMCVYSEVQEGRSKAGVEILLLETFGVFLREWRCIDERITWNQLKIECIWVMVVQVFG